MYPSDFSSFTIQASEFVPEGKFINIYNTALFNQSLDYSQISKKTSDNLIWIDINFKNNLYLTHVSFRAREVKGSAWKFPTNFAIFGSNEAKQTVSIFKNQNSNYLNQLEPVVMKVRPGIYHSIRIEQYDLSIEFIAISYLELFGSICYKIEDCYGNPMENLCSLQNQVYWHGYHFAMSIIMILLS